MAVGLPLKTTYADGDVWSASDANDITGTINTTAAPYAAGKNKIINGDFSINQRNFTSTTTFGTYGFDRFKLISQGAGGTATYSAQTFTTGAAPVAGYEGANFARIVTASFTTTDSITQLNQEIENVRTFAGQTVTVSFWAKAASGTPKILPYVAQNFGTGGSPSTEVLTGAAAVQTITTSWARYSFNISVPSISGKTIGTTANTSYLGLRILVSCGSSFSAPFNTVTVQNNTFDVWGIQIEQGSTATAFQTATGNPQGELAACQRYYWRNTSPGLANTRHSLFAPAASTTQIYFQIQNPVPMRVTPTAIDYSALVAYDNVGIGNTITPTIDANANSFYTTVTATSTGLTQYRSYCILGNSGTSSLGLSAEL
jgi:hypothetical protein